MVGRVEKAHRWDKNGLGGCGRANIPGDGTTQVLFQKAVGRVLERERGKGARVAKVECLVDLDLQAVDLASDGVRCRVRSSVILMWRANSASTTARSLAR